MSLARMGTMLIGLATVVVLGSVVASLSIIGSPSDQREARIDQRRVMDLIRLQGAIERHWDESSSLPASLAELAKTPGLRLQLADRNNGPAYEYRVNGTHDYELCATFATDTAAIPEGLSRPNSEDWLHGKGRHCFKRSTAGRKEKP